MYTLHITLCITAGGNAFPQPQRRLRIWYYELCWKILLAWLMSSVMFSGGVHPVIIVRRRHEIIINLCVSHFGYVFRISRIMDFIMRWHCAEAQCENTKRRLLLFSYGNIIVMDTFITVDMYIFIVMAFLWTPLIKNQILRYVVYKPHLLLLLLFYKILMITYKLMMMISSAFLSFIRWLD